MEISEDRIYEREAVTTRDTIEAPAFRGARLEGYAIRYGVKSRGPVELGGVLMVEVIERGAFDEYLATNPNVSFTFQHKDFAEYGDTASGSLRLYPDDLGIRYSLDLPTYAQTLREQVESGAIRGMSFGFMARAIEVRNGVRHIVKATLDHISPVYAPAYPTTSVDVVRSLDSYKKRLDLREKIHNNRHR